MGHRPYGPYRPIRATGHIHHRLCATGQTTHAVLLKYLTDPKKIKDVDGNITLGADFAPTNEEMYQNIFSKPFGSRAREVAIAEYNIHMLSHIKWGTDKTVCIQ